MRVPEEERKIVYVVSAFLASLIAGSSVLVNFILGVPTRPRWDDLMIVAFMVGLAPCAFVNMVDRRWRVAIDRYMPYLVKEISEGTRSGLSFTRSIEAAGQRRYGPLTKEIQRVVSQISWGVNLEEALKSFADRVDTPQTKRTTYLLMETSRSGGNIQEILDSIYEHVNTMDMVERERKSMMKPFLWISYMAFGIFVMVGVLIFKFFFSQMAEAWAKAPAGLWAQPIDLQAVTRSFFHMSIIEGFTGGLVAGKMSEGSMGSGLKHSLLLMIIAFLVFYIFVW